MFVTTFLCDGGRCSLRRGECHVRSTFQKSPHDVQESHMNGKMKRCVTSNCHSIHICPIFQEVRDGPGITPISCAVKRRLTQMVRKIDKIVPSICIGFVEDVVQDLLHSGWIGINVTHEVVDEGVAVGCEWGCAGSLPQQQLRDVERP
jgi:hypothetical protein